MKEQIDPCFDDAFSLIASTNQKNVDMPTFNDNFNKMSPGHTHHSDDNTNETLEVEAFTLAWVAMTLAEGALSALGAKIFNEIFDKPIDLYELQKDTLKQIENIVQEAISADAI